MEARKPLKRKALPTWVSAVIIAVVIILIGAIYYVKGRQPSSRLPQETPELARIHREMSESFKKNPGAMVVRRGQREPSGEKKPAQPPLGR